MIKIVPNILVMNLINKKKMEELNQIIIAEIQDSKKELGKYKNLIDEIELLNTSKVKYNEECIEFYKNQSKKKVN